MKDLLKESNQQKHQFRSYYCIGCKQVKPCQLLAPSECCRCYYQNEQERTKEYSDYRLVYQRKVKEKKVHDKQLQLLRSYPGCNKCGSKEVDAYFLYSENQLVCQPCRMKKEGGSSGPISFLERQKWYKKHWKIDLTEWLDNYQKLLINAECAREWLKDRNHLNNCQCLEQETQNLVDLFTSSLKEQQDKLAKCSCKKSEKVRVDSDYYAWCERCQEPISVASKKRVIKNRNDPKFWGLEVKEKVLCLNCLQKFQDKIPISKRYTLNKYLKRGY